MPHCINHSYWGTCFDADTYVYVCIDYSAE